MRGYRVGGARVTPGFSFFSCDSFEGVAFGRGVFYVSSGHHILRYRIMLYSEMCVLPRLSSIMFWYSLRRVWKCGMGLTSYGYDYVFVWHFASYGVHLPLGSLCYLR